jgi:hypothetical protein
MDGLVPQSMSEEKMSTMQKKSMIVFTLMLLYPVLGWGEIRNAVTGSDGGYYMVTAQTGGNVIVTRNAEPLSVQPQSTVFVSSVPAITRVGNRLYG